MLPGPKWLATTKHAWRLERTTVGRFLVGSIGPGRAERLQGLMIGDRHSPFAPEPCLALIETGCHLGKWC